MTRIKLSEARPGQVLGEDVSDPRGGSLATAGTPLTPALMDALKLHGIGEVALQPEPPPSAQGDLDRMFEGTLDNPLMAALLDAAKRRRTGKAK